MLQPSRRDVTAIKYSYDLIAGVRLRGIKAARGDAAACVRMCAQSQRVTGGCSIRYVTTLAGLIKQHRYIEHASQALRTQQQRRHAAGAEVAGSVHSPIVCTATLAWIVMLGRVLYKTITQTICEVVSLLRSGERAPRIRSRARSVSSTSRSPSGEAVHILVAA